MDLLLRDQHRRYSSCHLACLDVSKAFDSESHPAIFASLESYGFPARFVAYIKSVYSTSLTQFKIDGWLTDPLGPSVGVEQGDPLSPLMFNLIIDGLLRSLPSHIAASIDTIKVNALAFADDLILAANTPDGLQDLIDHTQKYLESCGLKLNPAKCRSLSIQGQPKRKRTVIEDRRFMVRGHSKHSEQREFHIPRQRLHPDGENGVFSCRRSNTGSTAPHKSTTQTAAASTRSPHNSNPTPMLPIGTNISKNEQP